MTASPAQIVAAWRAFRSDRSGMLIGPGPGFREAIEAAMAVGEAERAAAFAEVSQLRSLFVRCVAGLMDGEGIGLAGEMSNRPESPCYASPDEMEFLRSLERQVEADAAVRRLAGVADAEL